MLKLVKSEVRTWILIGKKIKWKHGLAERECNLRVKTESQTWRVNPARLTACGIHARRQRQEMDLSDSDMIEHESKGSHSDTMLYEEREILDKPENPSPQALKGAL